MSDINEREDVAGNYLFGEEVQKHPILLVAYRVIKSGVGKKSFREQCKQYGDRETISKIVVASILSNRRSIGWLEIWGESFETEASIKDEIPGYIFGVVQGIFEAAHYTEPYFHTDEFLLFHTKMLQIIKDIILCQRQEIKNIDRLSISNRKERYWLEFESGVSEHIKPYIRGMSQASELEPCFRELVNSLARVVDYLQEDDTLEYHKLTNIGYMVFEQLIYTLFGALDKHSLQAQAVMHAFRLKNK